MIMAKKAAAAAAAAARPPSIHHRSQTPPRCDALVCAPTRELAIQIHAECARYGEPSGIDAVCVYGGAPAYEQKNAIAAAAKNTNGVGFIVVATPGRLCDLMEQRALALDRCAHVVLDEADRMLDMGFEPQARSISHWSPYDRVSVVNAVS